MQILTPARAFLLVSAALLAIYWYSGDQTNNQESRYRTRAVDHGDIVQTISANGTLTPLVLVNVGTQISGTVTRLYADFNDQVEIGQVLAELDPALLRAQLQQSKANLLNSQTALKIARSKLQRHRILKQQAFISPEALEMVEQEAEAARAQVAIHQAQVDRDQANLGYSVIRSPISGVVIARDVDVGQTVAANFQTPTLFKIANDLRQMQINISVAEADIGQLHLGQVIKFTVDAFQQRKFTGTVKQVRLNPTIQENVVTYNVVAIVDNADGSLLPGMTANIHFIVLQKNGVLRTPNAALRYQPKDTDIESSGKPGPSGHQSRVFVLADGKPKPVNVTASTTDGNYTEITHGDIKAGDHVIISETIDKKEAESKFKLRFF